MSSHAIAVIKKCDEGKFGVLMVTDYYQKILRTARTVQFGVELSLPEDHYLQPQIVRLVEAIETLLFNEETPVNIEEDA